MYKVIFHLVNILSLECSSSSCLLLTLSIAAEWVVTLLSSTPYPYLIRKAYKSFTALTTVTAVRLWFWPQWWVEWKIFILPAEDVGLSLDTLTGPRRTSVTSTTG